MLAKSQARPDGLFFSQRTLKASWANTYTYTPTQVRVCVCVLSRGHSLFLSARRASTETESVVALAVQARELSLRLHIFWLLVLVFVIQIPDFKTKYRMLVSCMMIFSSWTAPRVNIFQHCSYEQAHCTMGQNTNNVIASSAIFENSKFKT